MVHRTKSERELKWEQEHAADIEKSMLVMKEIMKKELINKKKIKEDEEKRMEEFNDGGKSS